MGLGKSPEVPEYLQPIVRNFQISRMGAGEGIDWETGNWGSMPSFIVECFLEISGGIGRGMEVSRKRSSSKSEVRGGGGTGGRRPYRSGS